MKQLLLLITLFTVGIFSSFGQVPTNDLIQNATLIEESPFVDTNVRLDLATPSSGGQMGCNLVGNPLVYYKFTASVSQTISAGVEDTYGGAVGNFFTIIYSAPNLNVTSDTQLTVVSTCTLGNNTVNVVQGQSYYILVRRYFGAYSNVIITINQTVPVSERNALLDIYNATNGASWANTTNWVSALPVSQWFGIIVKNGHVSKIILNNNNLNGSLPASIINLPNLEEINISSNFVTGIVPDFGGFTSLTSLNITRNIFSFQDLETHYASNTALTNFVYSPQNKTDTVDAFDGVIGNNYSLTMTPVNGTNVQYQWYKKRINYFDASDVLLPGVTTNAFALNNLQETDLDIYFCKATSSLIPNLTIERNSINIKGPVSQLQKDALIAIYNATNGTNWINNTNWLSALPVSEWFGVTVTGNSVTKLDFYNNNLTGTLPPEIGNLTNLQWLSFFSEPNLNGTLPIEIGNLLELRVLGVEFTSITGIIPSSYNSLNMLRGFFLDNNQLSGILPAFANSYPDLVFFEISNNNFNGAVPNFTNLQKIKLISIGTNKFQFGDFENEFSIYQTNLNSDFAFSPQKLVDQPYAEALTIGGSTILTSNVSGSQNNYQWYKDGVLLTGETNSTLNITINSTTDYGTYTYQATSNIVTNLILISHPKIIGELPTTSPDYSALIALYNSTIGNNWTNNTNWLDNTKPLNTWHGLSLVNNRVTNLNLGDNNLTGTLPTEIGNLSELTLLYLYSNHITGALPTQLGNLSKLIEMDLSPNNFSGSIPTEIGNLTNLEVLWLNQNGLSGSIPQSFQNLANLRELYLIGTVGVNTNYNSSSFSGTFPDLTALPLQVLAIERNHFTFNDYANQFTAYSSNIPNFTHSPQYTLDIDEVQNFANGQTIVLTLTDVPATNRNTQRIPNSYQWYKDNTTISGANSNSYTITNSQASDSGIYHCVITNTTIPNMEIHRAPITVNIGVLSVEDTIVSKFKIFPNPTKGTLTITNAIIDTSYEISIFNVLGEKILTKKLSKKTVKMNLENQKSGIYFVKIKTDTGSVTKKIIKI